MTADETPEQIEIRELRALLAAKQAEQAAPPPVRTESPEPAITKGTTSCLVPGDQIHFTATGLMLRTGGESFSSASIIGQKGQTVTLTDQILRANTDGQGRCALDLVDDESAQIARWGEVKLGRGPAPEGMTRWTRGTVEEDLAREHALLAAWQMPQGAERDQRLEEVRRAYGRKATSQTLNEWRFER